MSTFDVQFGQRTLPLSVLVSTPGTSVGPDPSAPNTTTKLVADGVTPGLLGANIILGLPLPLFDPRGRDFHFTTTFGVGTASDQAILQAGFLNATNLVMAQASSYSGDFANNLETAGWWSSVDFGIALDTNPHVFEILWNHTTLTFSSIIDGGAPITTVMPLDFSGPLYALVTCSGGNSAIAPADMRISQFKLEI